MSLTGSENTQKRFRSVFFQLGREEAAVAARSQNFYLDFIREEEAVAAPLRILHRRWKKRIHMLLKIWIQRIIFLRPEELILILKLVGYKSCYQHLAGSDLAITRFGLNDSFKFMGLMITLVHFISSSDLVLILLNSISSHISCLSFNMHQFYDFFFIFSAILLIISGEK